MNNNNLCKFKELHEDVIECKKTTKRNASEAKLARQNVFKEVATHFPNRGADALEKCYANMRYRAIEKQRKNMAERNKTGGGEPKIVEYTLYEEELLSFIKKAEQLTEASESFISNETEPHSTPVKNH